MIETREQCLVEVIDTGEGISKEVLPYVFDRYFKTAGNLNELPLAHHLPKTGLGLAIVKRILLLHNANVEVSSEPRKGAVFRFCLPAIA